MPRFVPASERRILNLTPASDQTAVKFFKYLRSRRPSNRGNLANLWGKNPKLAVTQSARVESAAKHAEKSSPENCGGPGEKCSKIVSQEKNLLPALGKCSIPASRVSLFEVVATGRGSGGGVNQGVK
jgi:hypothetical protein